MSNHKAKVEEFVSEERSEIERIVDSGEYGDLDDVMQMLYLRAYPVALGLFYLGEVEVARDWFAAIAPGPVSSANHQLNKVNDPQTSRSNVGGNPWRDCYMALRAAVFSGDRTVIDETVDDVREVVTGTEVERIPDRDNPWIDFLQALTLALGDSGDVDASLNRLRERIDGLPADRFPSKFFPPHTTAIEGLHTDDPEALTRGIVGLVEYHVDNEAYSNDVQLVNRVIAKNAVFYIVLGRLWGFDVRVDSEYVPESVYEIA